MKIDFKKIDLRQGKYWFPLVLFVPLVAIAYFSCVLNKTRVPYRNGESCLRRQINPSKDWSKDVVASGRVMAANAKSAELKTIE